ncbi:MAG: glycosyltransferase [Candidatus Berkelbacteria bacterium]
MKPKISCIMPCRDRDDMVAETIQSLIDQTFSDWELIVVDDHSAPEDKTQSVISDFGDDRIFYIKLEDKYGKGISAARNFGNMLARGNFVAIIDSDDINYPDRLALTVEALENGADVVYGDIDLWDPETGDITKRDKNIPTDFDLELFKAGDFIPNMTVAYTKKLAVDFPYNTFFRIAEDYDFLTRVAEFGAKFKFISQPLVKARMHAGSITAKKDFEFNYGQVVKYNRGWVNERPEIFGR